MNIPVINNLFEKYPSNLEEESFEDFLNNEHFRLERIVSEGHTTPEGTWLCEDFDEWVVLLKGSAKLMFQDDRVIKKMNPGDYCIIPAGLKHRVEWTDPAKKTVWLALHYDTGKKGLI